MKCNCGEVFPNECKNCRLVILYNNLVTPFSKNSIGKLINENNKSISRAMGIPENIAREFTPLRPMSKHMDLREEEKHRRLAEHYNVMAQATATGIPKKPSNVIRVDFIKKEVLSE